MIALSMIALNIFHPSRLLVDDEPAIQEKQNNSVTDA